MGLGSPDSAPTPKRPGPRWAIAGRASVMAARSPMARRRTGCRVMTPTAHYAAVPRLLLEVQVPALAIVLRRARMQRDVSELPDRLRVIGKRHDAPLQRVFAFVE